MPAAGLVARAALWSWSARAVWYPEAGVLAQLARPAFRRELRHCAVASGDGRLVAALDGVWKAAERVNGHPTLAEEHTFLFARQVLVSPRETGYAPRPSPDRTQTLAELGGLYAAFGYQVSSARPELPDHVSAECEFVAVMLAKEAYAVVQEWPTRARLVRRARQKFVREHIGSWFPRFMERLAQHGRLAFYPAVAELVLALLAAEGDEANVATTQDRASRTVGLL